MKRFLLVMLLSLSILSSGCSLIPALLINSSGTETEKSESLVKTSKSWWRDGTPRTEKSLEKGKAISKVTPPLTLIQKVGKLIAGMGLIAGVLFFIGGPALVVSVFAWVVNALRKSKRSVKEIVNGIKKTGVLQNNSELHEQFKGEGSGPGLSKTTIKEISDIKAKL